jgi:hypothetical protein
VLACPDMTNQRSSKITLDDVSDQARTAWTRLRDELETILGDDLVAMWAHGGTIAAGRLPRAADLDTYVIVNRRPDEATAQRIEAAHETIAQEQSVDWDVWYVLANDARRPDAPRHAYREGRRDTSWAINRGHWLAGRYVPVFGREPAEIVPAPTRAELDVDLRRELEHIERHVLEGHTDTYEASYALLNGSRILFSIATGNVAISKREAGAWALEHLPARWHAALRAATRAYSGQATPDDIALLVTEMAPFVAMVREQLPAAADEPAAKGLPRWSGY